MLNIPFSSVIPPEILLVFVLVITTVAYSNGCFEVASITFPEIEISDAEFWAFVSEKVKIKINNTIIFLVKTFNFIYDYKFQY